MSYFNSEQEDYIRSLNSMPPETRCWCGWYALGKCYNNCPKDKTLADKMKTACPECGNTKSTPSSLKVTHRYGCKRDNRGFK